MADYRISIRRTLGVLLLLSVSAFAAFAEDVGVRVLFRGGNVPAGAWHGKGSVEEAELYGVSGWRFQEGDAVLWQTTSRFGWHAVTRSPPETRRTNRPAQARKRPVFAWDNGLLLSVGSASAKTRLSLETVRGNAEVSLSDLAYGKRLEILDGKATIERTGSFRAVAETDTDDDFPVAIAGRNGSIFLAYVSFTSGRPRAQRIFELGAPPRDFSFLAEPAGGDRVCLLERTAQGEERIVNVTDGGGDIYKVAIAQARDGAVWVFWAERRDGQFDVWARPVRDGHPGDELRLTTEPGNDLGPVATIAPDGSVWVAWQGERNGRFRILARRQGLDESFGPEIQVSSGPGSAWAPAIASGGTADGASVAIVWDGYAYGDYDVSYATFSPDGTRRGGGPVANTPLYEARPTAAYDHQARLWIAWEEGGESWGKNYGPFVEGEGVHLYADRRVGLRVLSADGAWLVPRGELQDAQPWFSRRPGASAGTHGTESPRGGIRRLPFNNISRLSVDGDGRVWLLYRSRASGFETQVGALWLEYAAYHDGDHWVGPIFLPHSDNLLYQQPAPVAAADGGLHVFYASDHRQHRRYEQRLKADDPNIVLQPDVFANDIFESRLVPPPRYEPSMFVPAESPARERTPSPRTQAERKAIERARAYRTTLRGNEMRLLRGEFHRHTEISGDGGGDGPLEDMWRYAIDVAGLDWIGNGDHDAGNRREYPWWLIQKTTDAYLIPGRFTSLFSYERSRPFPEGHRNVVFPRRGIRVLPTLPLAAVEPFEPAPDTAMLYRYLRHFGGIASPHTTATDMGTDWRNNALDVEPVVEIYQGARQNYEREDAPRAAVKGRTLGGYRPEGFVNEALNRGYRLAFQASSDHRSTHISYANVYVAEPTRDEIFSALKQRRVYAATDNIIGEWRCLDGDDEFFMGETFSVSSPPRLRIHLEGTAPFAKVVIVKDDAYVQEWTPKTRQVDVEWTDPKPTPFKQSWYYVRGEQEDGELAWLSPMWIEYRPEAE